MYISQITNISNYRNLTGVQFAFDSELNFIVGENNIGKTNVVDMLYALLSSGKFGFDDFRSVAESVSITFTVCYSEDELGFFENNFDIDDEMSITIVANQETPDERIEFHHDSHAGAYINQRSLKKMNLIYYSSLRSPSKEINFHRNIGTGKVLNYLAKRSMEKLNIKESELIDMRGIEDLLGDVNQQMAKLNGLRGEQISAFVSDDHENTITRILQIGDSEGRELNKLGDGIQYSFNIYLHILDTIINLITTRKPADFESLLITNSDGDRLLPVLIALDEPEIHQHPYRQRALIKSIQRIMENSDEAFMELLHEFFEIDGLIGQVIVVTHSPNIVLNDYKQIIRLHGKEPIKATCGSHIELDDKIHKHLARSFVYLKEAMFSKSVILVEGDSEYGAVPIFAEKLGCDLDAAGVAIVKMDGGDGVLRYLSLYNAFNIRVQAIIDRDLWEKFKDCEDILFTTEIDFEEDIAANFKLKGLIRYMKETGGLKALIACLKRTVPNFDTASFAKAPLKYKVVSEIEEVVMTDIRSRCAEELRCRKNVITGILLASCVDTVPAAFEDIIMAAISEVSDHE